MYFNKFKYFNFIIGLLFILYFIILFEYLKIKSVLLFYFVNFYFILFILFLFMNLFD